MSSNAAFGEKCSTPHEPDVFQFTLVLDGDDLSIGEALENSLFEAGCDDALLSSVDGILRLDFDRSGESLEATVRSAIHDVEHCGQGIRVVAVQPPYAAEFESINSSLRRRGNGS